MNGFQGMERDSGMDATRMGVRHMASDGRWLQPEPLLAFGGFAVLSPRNIVSQYAMGNPNAWSDRSGYEPQWEPERVAKYFNGEDERVMNYVRGAQVTLPNGTILKLEIHYGVDPVHIDTKDNEYGRSTPVGTRARGATTISDDGSAVEVYINENLENSDAAATLYNEVKGHVIDISTQKVSSGDNLEAHAREETSDFIHRQQLPTNLVSGELEPPSPGEADYDDKGRSKVFFNSSGIIDPSEW